MSDEQREKKMIVGFAVGTPCVITALETVPNHEDEVLEAQVTVVYRTSVERARALAQVFGNVVEICCSPELERLRQACEVLRLARTAMTYVENDPKVLQADLLQAVDALLAVVPKDVPQ